ncbi:hypothetical protein [Glaciimonas soli]|uniref:Uncharacterized protein n=1 Tax=Glaciimonas soli TaxID=2590999 RepID=A0A843YYA2_9BURK|nr:hypothetical protein [Glaciimonas soli]MQR02448.1 hypothetical protein [Glaciimonas soli]
MISREQADVISDQLLNIKKNTDLLKIDIPRRTKTPLSPLLIISIFLMQFVSLHDKDGTVWIWIIIGIFYMALIFLVLYQKRTPLMKIEGDIWTCYGYFPWQKREFLFPNIAKVTLSPMLNIWRKAYSLTIQSSDGKFHVWLPNKYPAIERQLRQILAANLKERYSEEYA